MSRRPSASTRTTRDCLASSRERARFCDHGRYIHVTTYAPNEDEEGKLIPLECVVGENWVVTAHDDPIPVLEEFAERVSGSGNTGSLDGPGFLAALLEWVLGSYSAAFERIEQRLEEFDIEAMRGDGTETRRRTSSAWSRCASRSATSVGRSRLTAPRSCRSRIPSWRHSATTPRASSFSRC